MSRQPPPEIITCAQNAERQYKIPTSLQLAQWALESAWGSKCTGRYNFFGIKAKQGTISWTHEYIDGKYTACQQIFANYNSPQDAFDAHAELLADPDGHYARALSSLGDLEKYIKAIGPIYATDPHYADNVLNLIHSNHLDRYDLTSPQMMLPM